MAVRQGEVFLKSRQVGEHAEATEEDVWASEKWSHRQQRQTRLTTTNGELFGLANVNAVTTACQHGKGLAAAAEALLKSTWQEG